MRIAIASFVLFFFSQPLHAQPLPGTKPLEGKDDLARVMVDGIGKYLDRATAASVEQRQAYWKPDYSSPEAYIKSVAPNRERFKRIIGLIDQRLPATMEYVSTKGSALVAETKLYKVYSVRWPVLPGVDGEGLLLEPTGKAKANVIAIPDADQTPETLVGLAGGLNIENHFPRYLAENGCRVLVPVLVDRKDTWSGSAQLKRWTNQTHREFVYRMAYQMGRHIIGYEVQKVLAGVDWFSSLQDDLPIGVFGFEEGGLLALYSGAADTRIHVTCVSGHFAPREELYREPIYRNAWACLREFGDGEAIRLILPRFLIVEQGQFIGAKAPEVRDGRGGAAPGDIPSAGLKATVAEIDRIMSTVKNLEKLPRGIVTLRYSLKISGNDKGVRVSGPPGYSETMKDFLKWLTASEGELSTKDAPADLRKSYGPVPRQKRQFDQLVNYTQKLLPEAAAKPFASPMGLRLIELTDAWAQRRMYVAVRDYAALPAPARLLVDHLVPSR